MEEINLKEFFNYYKKYILIIFIVAVILVIGTSIYNIKFKTPLYTTKTSVVLVKNDTKNSSVVNDNESIDVNSINLNQKLVSTYRKIIKSRLVLEQVVSNLNLNYTFREIDSEVSVNAVNDTEILEISVSDEDPKVAASIANSIVSVFAKEVSEMYNINNVSILDKAQIPTSPSNNTLLRDVVLAVFVAVAGCSAIIFIVYYFDDTLRDTENIESEIEMPIIAKVFRDDSGIDLIVDKKPKAYASENIRTLRTNLQFSSVDEELQTLLVTSTLPNEGKSFISSNLAVSFAQAGKKVLLIDCDLRKGRQHKIFKVSSKKGLSTLLLGDVKKFADYVNPTKIEGLYVMSRGVFPPNPSELLSSKKNETLLNELKKHFDIIILDGAPCSGLSDSLILSSLVDKVLLVSSVNYTPKTELKNTKKALENVGANVAGCVANNIKIKRDSYGSGYYYTHYGYGYGYGEKN